MKRFVLLVTLLAVLFSFAGCGMWEKEKSNVFSLVKRNYDTIVAACEQKDKDTLLAMDGITDVRLAVGYVLVQCKSAGIAPSSQDYGFYYTENKTPIGVGYDLQIECYSDTMQPKGNGYEGTSNHNTFYTEQIKGNIYFFSNAY